MSSEATPKRAIVTSALPYANGPIHFGHIVGAYLPADIYTRHRRMSGDDVHFVCGTDEHGVAITLKAEQQGQDYGSYVDHWHNVISAKLAELGIEFDIFTGTSHHRNPFHRPLAQQFFTDLLQQGYLLEKAEEQFYSESMGRFLPDRYVTGTCYVCGHENARGDECPSCGTWLDPKRLKDPKSTLDGNTPVLKETTHWYLDLPRIRDEWLAEWFEAKLGVWKPNVANFVKSALADLHERPITRDLPWGVPVPEVPGSDVDLSGKVLYVWFEAPIGYLSISRQWFEQQGDPEGFETLWQSPETQLYHFIGKDNITFHSVVFPSMLHAAGRGWAVPENVPANEFFNLEGKKFNTSAGWFIPEESTKGRFPVDALRYGLAAMMPETADSDWSWKDFQSRLNDDLADTVGNFVSRVLRFGQRFLDGVIPEPGTLGKDDEAVLDAVARSAGEIRTALDGFQFRAACRELMALGGHCNRYFDAQAPWQLRKTDMDRCATVLRVCCELIRTMAIAGQPILPNTAKILLEALGCNTPARWDDAGGQALRGPWNVPELPVLFAKMSNDDVDKELQKLTELSKQAGSDNEVAADHDPVAEQIEFDQFAGVDLRVGQITSAEKHPKADRLLVLAVDLGFEQRTIVSGIAASYAPEELVGRKVIAVANLGARKLRGIESQGMLLAADDADGKPRLLAADQSSPNGTRAS